MLFNTRKTVNQLQGGVAVEQALSGDDDAARDRLWRAPADRTVPRADGRGADVVGRRREPRPRLRRYRRAAHLPQRAGGRRRSPFRSASTATACARQRQGFVNNNGDQGELRRDEDDTVTSGDVYAEVEWRALPALSLTLGVRSSRVQIRLRRPLHRRPESRRQRLSATYTNTSPIAGDRLARAGRPQRLRELRAGLRNADVRRARVSPDRPRAQSRARPRHVDVGRARRSSGCRRRASGVNLAVFAADTSQEIVVDTATGGRTTYRNASKTRRRGFEAVWDARPRRRLHRARQLFVAQGRLRRQAS